MEWAKKRVQLLAECSEQRGVFLEQEPEEDNIRAEYGQGAGCSQAGKSCSQGQGG